MIPLVFFVYNIYVPWHWKNTRIANTFNKWKLFFVDSIHLSRKIMLAFLLSGNIHKSIWTDMDTITNIGSYFIMTLNQVFFYRLIAIIYFSILNLDITNLWNNYFFLIWCMLYFCSTKDLQETFQCIQTPCIFVKLLQKECFDITYTQRIKRKANAVTKL